LRGEMAAVGRERIETIVGHFGLLDANRLLA